MNTSKKTYNKIHIWLFFEFLPRSLYRNLTILNQVSSTDSSYHSQIHNPLLYRESILSNKIKSLLLSVVLSSLKKGVDKVPKFVLGNYIRILECESHY